MAWNLTTILASGVIIGGVTIGTLTFTESQGLTDIRNTASSFKDKITNLDTSLSNWKLSFNNLKAEATSKIQDANTKLQQKLSEIASLQSQIADLQSQVSSGASNSDVLQQEIERLNSELTRANSEVSQLQADIEAMKTQVGTTGDTVEASPDATLPAVDEATSPTGTTGTETTTPPASEPAPTDYMSWFDTTQQTQINNMSLSPITDISVKPNGTGGTNVIAVSTTNTNFVTAIGSPTNQTNFKNSIKPTIETHLGVTANSMDVYFYVNGTLKEIAYKGGTWASK
jgi:uncharacterized phage infection (PIP) family protein YhgE